MRKIPENYYNQSEAKTYSEVMYHPAEWDCHEMLYKNPTEGTNIMVHTGSRLP